MAAARRRAARGTIACGNRCYNPRRHTKRSRRVRRSVGAHSCCRSSSGKAAASRPPSIPTVGRPPSSDNGRARGTFRGTAGPHEGVPAAALVRLARDAPEGKVAPRRRAGKGPVVPVVGAARAKARACRPRLVRSDLPVLLVQLRPRATFAAAANTRWSGCAAVPVDAPPSSEVALAGCLPNACSSSSPAPQTRQLSATLKTGQL